MHFIYSSWWICWSIFFTYIGFLTSICLPILLILNSVKKSFSYTLYMNDFFTCLLNLTSEKMLNYLLYIHMVFYQYVSACDYLTLNFLKALHYTAYKIMCNACFIKFALSKWWTTLHTNMVFYQYVFMCDVLALNSMTAVYHTHIIYGF